MPSLKVRFAENVRTLRQARGLTQEEFADKAGISVDFVGLIERGINAPSFETLDRIAKALNTHVKDLSTNDYMDFTYRKSKSTEDSLKAAQQLNSQFSIAPYAIEELGGIISAGARAGELQLEPAGRSSVIRGADKWFQKRVMQNTVTISTIMYKKALYRALRLILVAHIARTDFGSSRQRDFGQRLTDFTRGFLGEIVLEAAGASERQALLGHQAHRQG